MNLKGGRGIISIILMKRSARAVGKDVGYNCTIIMIVDRGLQLEANGTINPRAVLYSFNRNADRGCQ